MKIYIERTLVIVLVTVVSTYIPNFVTVLNLSGSIGSSMVAFIMPPIYYIQFFGVKKLGKLVVALNICICIFGISGGIYSIYISILAFINPPT